jgi:hypothetical protein
VSPPTAVSRSSYIGITGDFLLVSFRAALANRTTSYSRPGEGGKAPGRHFLATAIATALLAVVAAVMLTGCGADRQDENEESGTWKVDVLSASFPGRQRLAEESQLRIKVKNVDTRTVPNLAVTVDGFDARKEDVRLSDPRRPIWVIDSAPENTTTAYSNTWAIGPVPAGEVRSFVWDVAAVRAGTYTVRFRVGAGLDGKAKARLPDGSIPKGSFIARVSDKPRNVKVQ